MTKPLVWVQFTVKRNWWQNCSSFEISNLSKTMAVFSVLIKIFSPQLRLICSSFEFRSYYGRSDDFELDEPWKIWQLIYMALNQENESGTKCWLTGLIRLSLKQFYLTEENLKMFYNLKSYSNEGFGSQIRYWTFLLNPILNYGTPFPNINLLLSLRWRWRLRKH